MPTKRAHQALILVVDDDTQFLSGIIQRLESKSFIKSTKSKASPSLEKPIILNSGNVTVVLTPSFDEAERRLSDPAIVATFLDGSLGDPRPGCTGTQLAKIAIGLETKPSIYSISDSDLIYTALIAPALAGVTTREGKYLSKWASGIVSEIEKIASHCNSMIGEPIQGVGPAGPAP